jgi:predicted ATPase
VCSCSIKEPARAGNKLQVSYEAFTPGQEPPLIPCLDQQAVFTQLTTPARFGSNHTRSQQEIPAAADRIRSTLENIFFLDPAPGRMRSYSLMDDLSLRSDGSNLSSVLYALCNQREGEARILDFVRSLPEQDIKSIGFLNTPRGEVMVKLTETFGGEERTTDATLLSDGTLRVLAAAAALLSVPEGSLVIIEELDNGVHPNRIQALLNNVQALAQERRLRVLLTTHNPALLDAIPVKSIPHVVACYRDPVRGDSRLVRL